MERLLDVLQDPLLIDLGHAADHDCGHVVAACSRRAMGLHWFAGFGPGMFSGMNYGGYPDSDVVLRDLGDEFIQSFIDAVDGARDDHREFRQWRPEWAVNASSRFTANLIHERIWDRLVRAVDGMESIEVRDREPVRELSSGTLYLMRIKRHHPGDRISAYPTEASTAFWSNTGVALDGLESHTIALGYYWDADRRTVGDALLSFRDGKNNPIWAVRLRRDEAEAAGFSWAPIAPDLPELDLSAIAGESEAESTS